MNDVHDEIRELLREKANEVPPHLQVPPSLTKRVGPRIVRNAVILTAAAALVIVVAAAGLRSVQRPTDQSFGTGTPAPVTPEACGADRMEGNLALEGAAGSRVGSIDLTNTSDATCTLEGDPNVVLLQQDGSPVDISIDHTEASWQVDRTGAPEGWPVVTLHTGEKASVRFSWSNACDVGSSLTLRVSSQDGTVVAEIPVDPNDVPPCNGADQPSTLQIGPFEPKTSSS